jgi:hypothetical protein
MFTFDNFLPRIQRFGRPIQPLLAGCLNKRVAA